ncbi:hypothetical protein [Rhodococcus opacus]|uniref:hypothetical protein n=1 Tax=Rhodococcus opacus TaxID=37919 RepID=UPI0024B9D93D|nr:hypothetical protein [Rhodococcus opacus]MDJ0420835.1 hypothetical protein [Rhodococcus opacus]
MSTTTETPSEITWTPTVTDNRSGLAGTAACAPRPRSGYDGCHAEQKSWAIVRIVIGY